MAEQRDGVWTWTHSDHLHSATVITDANGYEVRRLAYAAFGEEAENVGAGKPPKYTYTVKETDATGLMYYGARYYNPVLAQFISADTMYDRGPQGLNRYSYALNNPIIYRDPTGHLSVSPDDDLDVWAKTDGETDEQENDTYSDIWDVWRQEVNLRNEPSSEDTSPPVLTSHIDRRKSIINDTPAVIPMQGNPDADSSKPWYEWAGRSQVKKHDEIIIEVASSSRVDPNLIRTIENTHGWYDAPLVWIGKNKSILPMNINVGYWKNLGYSRDDLKDPQNNIEAGTKILKGIQDRIQSQTVEGTVTPEFAGICSGRGRNCRVNGNS